MCSAVFPAWALARLVVRPAYAFGVAAAAVAGGAMLYHSYLTSEALAFPVFLLAVSSRCARLRAVPALGRPRGARARGRRADPRAVRRPAGVRPDRAARRAARRHALALSARRPRRRRLVGGATLLGIYGGALGLITRRSRRCAGPMDCCAPSLHRRHGRRPRSLARSRLRDRATASTGEAALGVMSSILLVALPLQAD